MSTIPSRRSSLILLNLKLDVLGRSNEQLVDISNRPKSRHFSDICQYYQERSIFIKIFCKESIQILSLIGSGSQGAVFKIRDKTSRKLFALKDLYSYVNSSFFNEVEALIDCYNDFIVRFEGLYASTDSIGIVTEFMDGGSFEILLKSTFFKSKPMPEDILIYIGYSILKGIVYLQNNRGVLHRDLKPTNILFNRLGEVKLCDLGVACKLGENRATAKSYVGTSAYMAPERILGEEYSWVADSWSFGVTMYEIASGNFPHTIYEPGLAPRRPTPFEQISLILNEPMPSLPSYLSMELQDLLSECYTKDPIARPTPEKLIESPTFKRLSCPKEFESYKASFSHWLKEYW